MMQDKYRKRYRLAAASNRLRQQIASEAARRVYKTLISPGEEPRPDWLEAVTSNELYTAKRKAAAVLGHRLRPGDLPSDAEVREQLVALAREPAESAPEADEQPEPEPDDQIGTLAETLDRFAIYKMRARATGNGQAEPQAAP